MSTDNDKYTKNLVISAWSNSDNADFYKKISIDSFKTEAVQGGIDDGCDVAAATKYISNAKSILEVGAGYGRVIERLFHLGVNGEIYAVERDPKLCDFLKQRYPKITVFCEDIRRLKLKNKVDLIMWMWASLCEFSKSEQPEIIKKLASFLNHNGIMVLELIPITDKTTNAINVDQHNRVKQSIHGYDYGYFPSSLEINNYINQAHLLQREIINYKTKTNKVRNLYIFQKK